jgi:uncharacterized membrane protein YgcG
MTMRSKIATSALAAAVLSLGMAAAAEAHGSGNMGIRLQNPPQHLVVGTRLPPRPLYAGIVARLPRPLLSKPTWGTDCRPLDCRVHHATGGAANGSVSGGQGGGGGGGGGDGGGGGGSGHRCLSDRDCGPLRQD